VNLALSLALSGERTLLVDADLRRPRLHEYVGLANEVGLSSILVGSASCADAMQPVDVPSLVAPELALPPLDSEAYRHNLAAITAGPPVSNPTELLGSEAMRQLLRQVRNAADFIIVDSPPILLVGDSLSLLPQVDSVVLTTRINKLTTSDAARLRRVISLADAPIMGVVLTDAPAPSREHYGYYYHHRT